MKLSLGLTPRDYSVAGGASYDADAQAFITAAGLTDNTQKSAVNTLVLNLKSYGLWTKMKAVYPIVGGTASTHKFNLINPLDTNAAFRLTFSTGWTHSSTGMTPNGTSAYADTSLSPSTALTLNSSHISFYSRTDNSGSWDMGCYNATPTATRLELVCKATNNALYSINSSAESAISNTNGTGMYTANRTTATTHKLIKNNTINSTSANSSALPTRNVFIGAGNLDGGNVYGSKQCAFASIGDGLTDTEASNLYTAVQAFQTTLARQV